MSKSRDIADSAATINYIDTVTSNVQDQIDNLDPVPTNIAGGSAGTIPYQTAPDTTAMLAVGTAGQVLQTNGAGAPSWVTPAGGATVLLSTVTASNSGTVNIETTFDSTYSAYLLVVSDMRVTSDNSHLYSRFKMGGSYVTTGTYYGKNMALVSTTNTFNGDNTNGGTGGLMATGFGSASSNIAAFNINIYNPSSTTSEKRIVFSGVASGSSGLPAGTTTTFFGSASNSGTAAMTGLRLYMSVGNISGTFRLYGIVNS